MAEMWLINVVVWLQAAKNADALQSYCAFIISNNVLAGMFDPVCNAQKVHTG